MHLKLAETFSRAKVEFLWSTAMLRVQPQNLDGRAFVLLMWLVDVAHRRDTGIAVSHMAGPSYALLNSKYQEELASRNQRTCGPNV